MFQQPVQGDEQGCGERRHVGQHEHEYGDLREQPRPMGYAAVNNAYQKTSNAISKAIKKNKVKLKYGTFVYLVNGREKRE